MMDGITFYFELGKYDGLYLRFSPKNIWVFQCVLGWLSFGIFLIDLELAWNRIAKRIEETEKKLAEAK